ncbi:MAG: ABC transporter substrate-binding protein [Acidimicrobiales bacterium]|nr:ABC transporter substrate-binding protein [Acidimicrobiales bacterium]
MHRRRVTAATVVGALCALTLLLGAGGSPPRQSGSASGNVTLTVEGNTLAGPISGGFNPFLTTSDTWTLGSTSMIYEPLLQFNILRPGVTHPWLATSYSFSPDGKTLTFPLRQGVKWSDGQAFTSADVVYTFNLIKAQPALNANGISFESISANGPNQVVMSFASPAYSLLYAIAGQTLIVPQHLWSSVSNPGAYADSNPVGTGPYLLKSFSPQGFTLVKNPNYWQPGKPRIQTLNFPDYQSNDSANSALESGQLTWGGNFVSHIQKVFANTPTHQYFFPPDNTVALWPNMTKWPTNNLAVRQAISLVVNRQQVTREGEQGDEAPATTNTGLILPNDAQYLSSPGRNTLPHNPGKAKSILEEAGFKRVDGTWTGPNGQPVAFSILDPSSFSDYMASDQAIAQQLNQFGMKVTVDGVSVNAWNADLSSGDFQTTLHYGQTAATPYGQYDNWLDPGLIGGSVGNFERYRGPDATAALAQYAGSSNPASDRAAIQALGSIIASKLPVIPIMYGASWGTYNSSKVVGWPTEHNRYEPAQPSVPWDEYTVLQLRPRG